MLGLIAGRLVDEFNHPAVVIQVGEEVSRGSSRSIPDFNINEAMSQCADAFISFRRPRPGSRLYRAHQELIGPGRKAVFDRQQELDGLDLRPQIEIDAQAKFHELGGTTYQLIQQMAPFGQGNPSPVFLSRTVTVYESRPMGSNGQHLKLKLKQNNILWEAVAFGLGERVVEDKLPLDIVYTLEQDDWNGNSRLRLNIKDFAPSGMNI